MPRMSVAAVVLALVFPLSLPAAKPKKLAFLVGVAEYQKDGLSNLNYADDDVEALRDTLGKVGFEVDVLLRTEATGEAIRERFDRFVEKTKRLGKEDVVFVALCGHGVQIDVDRNGMRTTEAFFCPYDALKSDPETLLPINEVMRELEQKSGSSQNLLVIDACRNDPTRGGRGLDGGTVRELPAKLSVLFGCSTGQQSYESDKVKHGVFTHVILEGLQGKAINRKGEISWLSLAEYVTSEVPTQAAALLGDATIVQRPNLVGNLVSFPVLVPAWRNLFDGQSFAGWRGIAQHAIPSGWTIEGDAIVAAGNKTSVATVDEFRDFELDLEWKVDHGANGGVFYCWGGVWQPSVNDGLLLSAPEYQILDNVGHPNGRELAKTAGSVFSLYSPVDSATKPVGEWNRTRIVVRGAKVEHWLNDKRIVAYTIGSDDWKQRVAANPRYINNSDYGKIGPGRIALQSYVGKVWYRNIRLRAL